MQQLSLFIGDEYVLPIEKTEQTTTRTNASFSHDSICVETARAELERRYADIIVQTDTFSRKTVSFQSNKVQTLHNWIHYREGFSSELVALLFDELDISGQKTVLDPFAGSCTTLLQAMLHNHHAIGIELLPHCHLAWQAKAHAFDYDLDELARVKQLLLTTTPPSTAHPFPHLNITQSAFPIAIERKIVDYTYWINTLSISEMSKKLLRALMMSVLESVSYTRKDGQYLRWDGRADKIIKRNAKRVTQGKKPFRGIDKGILPTFEDALINKLGHVMRDIVQLQRHDAPIVREQTLLEGNTLFTLPTMGANTIDGVITSPPYANRYDYTRTYALELAYLGVDNEIMDLRQGLLSCTVENKPKREQLAHYYEQMGAKERYDRVLSIVDKCPFLQEVNAALVIRNGRGEINNKGVLRMIEQYFVELAFVFMELFRVCKPGAKVAFVNDNVRYAGEVIPVDTICTQLAEQVGFVPQVIYVIPQRKGNSSQQMKRFGRRALRKSITVWQKPLEESM